MQAAGGASLSDADHEVTSHPRRWPVFAAVALVGLAVDQISKAWVVANWTNDTELIGSLLTLHLTYNPGAAFSTGTRFTLLISCVAVVATVVVSWFGLRVRDRIWALGLGLLFAGVAGNLCDRLFRSPGPMRGHVVDFLQLPNWPIFNIADICINIAAGIIIVQSLRGVQMDGRRAESDRTPAHDGDGRADGSERA
ncbi:signal peptidase II [soil metagenome]